MKRKKQTRKRKIDATPVLDPSRIETLITPESSNIDGAVYDHDIQELVLGLRDKKKDGAPTVYYQYMGVSKEDWEGFKAAESKGKYKNEVIIKKYTGVKM